MDESPARYLEEMVEPTIKDFENNPTSVRYAFLAYVVTFHTVDYIGRASRKSSAHLRQIFANECDEFASSIPLLKLLIWHRLASKASLLRRQAGRATIRRRCSRSTSMVISTKFNPRAV